VLLSMIAAGLGVVLGAVLAPAFPMSISLGVRNCLELVAAAIGVGIVASVIALRRAIGVDPAVAFGGG
jgi:putative ABC transport system permease protein